MREKQHMTAFYLETVLMVIIFALVIAVLVQVFGQARLQSGQARQMTDAVCLAQNAAEAVAAADSAEALARLLDENGNVILADMPEGEQAAVVTAYYDEDLQPVLAPFSAANADPAQEKSSASSADKAQAADTAGQAADRAGAMRVETTWKPDLTDSAADDAAGTFVDSEISVYQTDEARPLYTLRTGVYLKQEVAP